MAANADEIPLGLSDDEDANDIPSPSAQFPISASTRPSTSIPAPAATAPAQDATTSATVVEAGDSHYSHDNADGNDYEDDENEDAAMMAAMGFSAFADTTVKTKPGSRSSDGKRKRPAESAGAALDATARKRQRTPPGFGHQHRREHEQRYQKQGQTKGANAVPLGQRRPVAVSDTVQSGVGDSASASVSTPARLTGETLEMMNQGYPGGGAVALGQQGGQGGVEYEANEHRHEHHADDERAGRSDGIYFKTSFIEDPWRGLAPKKFAAVGQWQR